MKRVLMLVPSLGMGGMERVCVNYANLLVDRGYDVTLYNLTHDSEMIVGALSEKVKYTGQIISRVPNLLKAGVSDILNGRFRTKRMEKWLKTASPQKLYRSLITDDPDRFDVEIAFYGGLMMRIISGSIQKKSVRIGWIHSTQIENHFSGFRSVEDVKRIYRSMDLLLCVSEVIEKKAKKLFGEDTNAETLHNPNNTSDIRKKAALPLTDIKKKKFTFINASRIDMNHKGFDRLIAAVRRLKDAGYDFEVWVLGSGKDVDVFQNSVRSADVGSHILYLGTKTNPYHYIRQADCYICSSRWEGFSMVVAETVIIGTPVISTDISGAREMLGDSEYGLVVNNDEDGIFDGMAKVLSDPDYFSHLKTQAQKRMDFLSEDVIMDRFEELLERTEQNA